jgi:hypothetical protein
VVCWGERVGSQPPSFFDAGCAAPRFSYPSFHFDARYGVGPLSLCRWREHDLYQLPNATLFVNFHGLNLGSPTSGFARHVCAEKVMTRVDVAVVRRTKTLARPRSSAGALLYESPGGNPALLSEGH